MLNYTGYSGCKELMISHLARKYNHNPSFSRCYTLDEIYGNSITFSHVRGLSLVPMDYQNPVSINSIESQVIISAPYSRVDPLDIGTPLI